MRVTLIDQTDTDTPHEGPIQADVMVTLHQVDNESQIARILGRQVDSGTKPRTDPSKTVNSINNRYLVMLLKNKQKFTK